MLLKTFPRAGSFIILFLSMLANLLTPLGSLEVVQADANPAPNRIDSYPSLSGLVGYWRMDEDGPNSTRVDSSGLGHDMAATGNMPTVLGKIGSAVSFSANGSNSLSTPDHADFNFSGGVSQTFTAWIYSNAYQYGDILNKGHGDGTTAAGHQTAFRYQLLTSGKLRVSVGNNSNDEFHDFANSSMKVSNGTYNFVAVVINHTTDTITAYVNSNSQTFAMTSAGSGLENIDAPLEIGISDTGPNSTPHPFNGNIDEVSLWRRALSGAEIAAIYNLNPVTQNKDGCPYPFYCLGDNTPPAASAAQNPLPYSGTWANTDVTARATATDSGIGVDALYCKVTGDISFTKGGSSCSKTTSVSTTFSYYAKDVSGNADGSAAAPKMLTINIDKIKPPAYQKLILSGPDDGKQLKLTAGADTGGSGARGIACSKTSPVTTTDTTALSCTLSFAPGEEPKTIYARTLDNAGNWSDEGSVDEADFTVGLGPSSLPDGTVGAAYSQTLVGSGGTAPYTYTAASGTLPQGLALDASSGVLSGIPAGAGTFSFNILAADAHLVAYERNYALVVGQGTSTVSGVFHNASHTVVTSVNIGSSVHASAAASGGGAVPGGNVHFSYFASQDCSGDSTDGGTASLSGGTGHPGGDVLITSQWLSTSAHYDGDVNYTAADSTCTALQSVKNNSITELTSSANPALPGIEVIFTAKVTPVDGTPAGAGTPGGTVTFMVDGSPFSGTLDGSGAATYNVDTLPGGTHKVTAAYGGDSNYNISASSELQQFIFFHYRMYIPMLLKTK